MARHTMLTLAIINLTTGRLNPFRGLKRDVYEGGHRVPFIVKWPGVTKAGTVSDALVSQIDIMATIADFVGYKLLMIRPRTLTIWHLFSGTSMPFAQHTFTTPLTRNMPSVTGIGF